MTTAKQECPFCGELAKITQDFDTLQSTYSDCLCGKFIIDKDALEDSGEYNKILGTDEDKILFSGYLRNNQPIIITSGFISESLSRILDHCQQIPLDKKISDIKRYIFQETTTLGKNVLIDFNKLYTLFYLKNSKELRNIMKYLKDTDILYTNTNLGGATANVLLTVEGFSKIEATQKDYLQSQKVFIACQFETGYQGDLVKTIKAACKFCGFDANIVSGERHNKDISHKIISDIRQSRFVIADFTGQNNGVYFEAGFAMGESKEVIRLINKEQIDKLHFDTRQFNHIQWEKGKWKELEEDLINQIKATIK